MKSFIYILCACIIFTIVMGSCSVQKRQYRKGYDITWKRSKYAHAPASSNTNIMSPQPGVGIAAVKTELDTSDMTAPEPQLVAYRGRAAKTIHHRDAQKPAASKPLYKSIRSVSENLLIPKTGSGQDDGRVNGFAIASLVLGILALVAYYGAFVLGVLAIIFGIIALNRIREGAGRGRAMALAGLICGIVALAIIMTIVLIVAMP